MVDDEEGIRELFRDELSDGDYICHLARDGEEALELLYSQPVDLALVDIVMPGMGGLGLFHRIRAEYPDVAVVFVTAMADLATAVDHIKDGAYDYAVKPVTRSRLLQTVEEGLRKRDAIILEVRKREDLEERTLCLAKDLQSRVRELRSLNRMIVSELALEPEDDEVLHQKAGVSPRSEDLRQGVMLLQESVKKRVSEFLHGPVQSKLLILQHRLAESMELVQQEPERAAQLLEQVRDSLKEVQESDLRKASHELYPSVVRVGLVPALRSLVDRFRDAVHLELNLDPEIEVAEQQYWKLFPEAFRIGVHRIAEEALENVIKHSSAGNCKISLRQSGSGHIVLEGADDGQGYVPSSVSSSFGLQLMRDYADALGGGCTTLSQPGKGACVRATLPLPTAWPVATEGRAAAAH